MQRSRAEKTKAGLVLNLILSVVLVLSSLLVVPGVAAAQTGTLISAGFDTGADGFSYQDDAFRGTGQPGYASGSYEGSGGYSGGGLRVYLGAIDSNVIRNMSGGWVQGFSLGSAATVTVSFRYNLRMSSEYESDEYGQVLVSLDGVLYGQGGDSVAQMSGNGNGGSTETTGWQQFQFSAPLAAGSHTLVLGGYNNKKTYNNEWTEVLVDDVVVTTGSMPPVADAGPDQSVTDGDGNGSESVTLDGTDSYDGDGTIVSYEWSEGGGPIASGENPTVVLAVGTHNITLTVRDNDGETDADVVVINVSAPGAAQAIVDRLSLSLFKSNIADLASFGDRCQMTGCSLTSYNNAQNWLEGQLAGLGYNVERHYYSYNGSTRASTYVTKVGTVRPDQMYMVACHLDGRGGGGAADDNGSGCSLLMEAARVFAMGDVETDVSIRFLFWGNEETGLHGSTQYRDDRVGLQGIENPAGSGQYPEPEWLGNITHDMVLYDHGVPAQSEQNPNADLDVEYRAGTSYEAASHQLADYVAGAAGKYSADYPAEVNNYSTNTDDTPYHNYCPSISVRENRRLNEISGVHPYYHTSGDVYSNYSELDFKLGFNAVQMTVGAVAELSGARIVSANEAPVADAQSVTTAEETAVGIMLTGSDPEGQPLSFVVTGGPSHGMMSGSAPNLTYTPEQDYVGGDSFTFVANDGQANSAPATVSITVTGVNDAPVAFGQSVAVNEDAAVLITLTGTDVDGDALTYGVASDPSQGTLAGSGAEWTYTPAADYNGADSFTFQVSDGELVSAAAVVQITVDAVNDAPVANPQSVVTDEDVPLAFTLGGWDLEGDALTFEVVTVTGQGTLETGGLPALIYRPDGNYYGPDSFTFRVWDGSDYSAEATIDIAVNSVNDIPEADSQSISTVEDIPVGIVLTGRDADADPLYFYIVSPPAEGTLNGDAPNVTYTPDGGYVGLDSFTFKVNDGMVDSAVVVVDITVTEYNEAPVAEAQLVTTAEDTAVGITLTGSDPDDDSLTYSVDSGPAHGTLSGTAPGLSYTPDADWNGADSFTFKVNDGQLDSAPAVVSITVTAVNDAPVASGQAVATDEDVAMQITLGGADVDGDPLSYAVTLDPSQGTLSGTGAVRTYTPAADYHGPDSFTFKVNDGNVDSTEATVSITVNAVNDAPVVADDGVDVMEDGAVSGIAVLANDTDADGDLLSVDSVTQPAHGTAVLNANDTVSYTPGTNYCGPDSFGYTASDGNGGSGSATVGVDVTCVNDAPAADGQALATAEGTPVAVTLTASDVEGDDLTFRVVAGPSQGSLSGSAPDVTYTPDAGFTGADSFTFVAHDGTVDSSPATVDITVTSAGPSTVFEDDFETDKGWVEDAAGSDTATTGMWQRANPEGTDYNGAKQLGNTVSGSYDLVTGALAGSGVGTYDVDGGVTSMRSPAIMLPAGQDLTLSFFYYMAHTSNSSADDFLRVKVVGASTATVFEELGAAIDDDAAWASTSVSLNSFAGQTVYLLVEAADASNGSIVEAGIDDVSIMAGPPPTNILEATFDGDAEGFAYADDAFRGTNAPAYASGSWDSGSLRVYLGAINGDDIVGMSGAWQESFNLASPATVTISFRYNLTISGEYESDEFGEALVSVDGTLHGTGANDYVAHLAGNGNGGAAGSTGWQQFSFSADLGAGDHSLVIGGYNNKKTYADEWTEVLVDDVVVAVR